MTARRASSAPAGFLAHPGIPVPRAAWHRSPLCGIGRFLLLLAPAWVQAQQAAPPAADPAADATVERRLPTTVVTATRSAAEGFGLPASIDAIDGEDLRRARALANLAEALGSVPGLLARDRQNYAQDVQISVRGFGARATFGIRGLRVYVDGIPATMPDGQGQVSHIDLASAERLEVLRGPFSALYGNSSGGVLQVFTEEGHGAPRLHFSSAVGSDGLWRLGAQASGEVGGLSYLVGASRLGTDGYREHSAARRDIGNAKFALRPDADSRLVLVANSVALPLAQDPLGLTRAQWAANPRGVDPAALAFDTRKTVAQTQLGFVYERALGGDDLLTLTGYGGQRRTVQFQSIPVATQANPLHAGGVIALGRNYAGLDLRWSHATRIAERPFTLVLGLSLDRMGEEREGYENFSGATLGVMGRLRRDERNRVRNADQYLQGTWDFAKDWSLLAGLRHSRVRFDSRDAYITPTNPDDSGRRSYAATTPALGLRYAARPWLHLHAALGSGFETPTFNELSYRPGGASGLNLALQAARSRSVELGAKLRDTRAGEFEATLFQTRTRDEIVTQTNLGGRSTFQNAGSTRRNGAELAWRQGWAKHLRAQAALTWLDARYTSGFSTCAATPCALPTLAIPAGRRIPGLASTTAWTALDWLPPTGWRGGVELRHVARVAVNDANAEFAPAATVAGAHLGHVLARGAWRLESFLRVDNLLDRRYAGSVIVNEGNGRYYEPAPGRSWLLGLSATLPF